LERKVCRTMVVCVWEKRWGNQMKVCEKVGCGV